MLDTGILNIDALKIVKFFDNSENYNSKINDVLLSKCSNEICCINMVTGYLREWPSNLLLFHNLKKFEYVSNTAKNIKPIAEHLPKNVIEIHGDDFGMLFNTDEVAKLSQIRRLVYFGNPTYHLIQTQYKVEPIPNIPHLQHFVYLGAGCGSRDDHCVRRYISYDYEKQLKNHVLFDKIRHRIKNFEIFDCPECIQVTLYPELITFNDVKTFNSTIRDKILFIVWIFSQKKFLNKPIKHYCPLNMALVYLIPHIIFDKNDLSPWSVKHCQKPERFW